MNPFEVTGIEPALALIVEEELWSSLRNDAEFVAALERVNLKVLFGETPSFVDSNGILM